MKSISWLVPAVSVLLPFGASAQTSDASYCKALTQKYETYISSRTTGRTPGQGTVDGSVAIEQCKVGNTASAIPVLEHKLRDGSTCRRAASVRPIGSTRLSPHFPRSGREETFRQLAVRKLA